MSLLLTFIVVGMTGSPCSAQERRKLTLIPELVQGVYFYDGHPLRGITSATTARLSTWLFERWLIGASYRFSHMSGADATAAPWRQHDVYASAGYAERRFGVMVHYGMLSGALVAAMNYADTSHHVGFSARYSPFGDGVLAFSASLYSTNSPVLRSELGWRFPIYAGLSVRPAFALQWSPEGFRPNGSLTVRYDHYRFGVFAGAKYGEEKRPAYLAYEVIYNGPDRIPFGVWGGGYGLPGRGFMLSLGYAMDHLLYDGTDASGAANVTASYVHYLTLGLSKEF